MLQKFLLIGVGGSGGKTLRYTWHELDRGLRARGWTQGVPDAWRFVHIDVPEKVDVVSGDVPATIGAAAEYVGLAKYPERYADHDRELCSRPELLPAIAGWRPDPTFTYGVPYKGAGQRRVVGKVVTVNRIQNVAAALDRAVAALSDNEVSRQLRELNRLLGYSEAENNADPVTTMVISSLGGGAGSGAFLEIVELIKRRFVGDRSLGNSLATVLYAPDVFTELGANEVTGVQPNSLAALSELISAFEHEGPVPDLERRLLNAGGGAADQHGRRSAQTNFMVGRGNGQITYKHSGHVYRAVGKALATFMSDHDVQQEFVGYVTVNLSAPAVTHEFRLGDTGGDVHPFTSLGYANVSLGRSLFADYAAERLARKTLDRLLRGDRNPSDTSRSPEVQRRESADAYSKTFFAATGLWEESVENNQVLDALRDTDAQASRLNDFVKRVEKRASGDHQALPPKEWFESFTAMLKDEAVKYEGAAVADRLARAVDWNRTVQQQLMDATATAVGVVGLSATVYLLDLLTTQLTNAAAELKVDAAEAKRDGGKQMSSIIALFKGLGKKDIVTSNPVFKLAAKRRQLSLERDTDAKTYEFTAELLVAAKDELVAPLRRTLAMAEANLAKSAAGEAGRIVAQWPDEEVPRHLQPAPNDLLLEPVSTFPQQFTTLLEGELGKAAEKAAVREIVSGLWVPAVADGRPVAQTLITEPDDWQPSVDGARTPGEAPRQATFGVDLDVAAVERRAREWVSGRKGKVNEHVAGTLRDWLSSAGDSVGNADRFVDVFRDAVKAAAPLVSINPAVHGVVHGVAPDAPKLVVSKIPLSASSSAGQRVARALAEQGVKDGVVAGLFDEGTDVSEVQISSFLNCAVQPVVMDSLMLPIQKDWMARDNQAKRTAFWTGRRARPLTSFVPLAPERQAALVRGWLVATVLGQVGLLEGRWSTSGPLNVWTPDGAQAFPRYLLGNDISRHGDVLPALLLSLPLALLSFSAGDVEEANAYMRLLDLGVAEDEFRGVKESKLELGQELVTWILDGTVIGNTEGTAHAPLPDPTAAGSPGDSPAARAEIIAGNLEGLAEGYRDILGGRDMTRQATLEVGPGWEASALIADVASKLARDVREIAARPSQTNGAFSAATARN